MATALADGKSSGIMGFVVLVLLLSLVGAGTGLAVGAFVVPSAATLDQPAAAAPGTAGNGNHAPDGSTAGHGTAEDPAPPIEDAFDPKLKVVPFPPILTTLAAPAGKWIRLEGSALVEPDTDQTPDVLAEKAAEQILTYLRTVSLHQIEGPSGLLGLREDINEMTAVLSNGQVRGILIHGLVVE